MNILFICNEYPPGPHGGIGTVTEVIAKGLHGRGHTVVVAGFYEKISTPLSITRDQGVLVYRLRQHTRFYGSLRSRFSLYLLIRKLVKDHSVDIVEVPDFCGLAAFWPRLAVPMVVRLHGSATYLQHESGQKVDRLHFLCERSTLRKASFIVAVSKSIALKTRLIFNLTSPMEIIYNSVDPGTNISSFERKRDPYKVVFTGTLMKLKGVFPLIEAWPNVIEQVPDARLHLFGKDSLDENKISIQSQLMQRIPQTLNGTIFFYGHVSHDRILDELGNSSVAVFPSFSETFGLAPLEAMSHGCPTVFTKLASGPEIINDGENGLLIDPFKPGEIAVAISKLLTDKNLAFKIGAEGRKSVATKFSSDSIFQQNEEMYKRVLAQSVP